MKFRLLENSSSSKITEEDLNTKDTYYRLSIEDYWGDNIGGLFNAIWKIIYHPDTEDSEDMDRLEDLIDVLQDRHQVPKEWLKGAKFAFTKDFYTRNISIILEISQILKDWGYNLLIDKVTPNNIIYRDKDQIAYKENSNNTNEELKELSKYDDNLYTITEKLIYRGESERNYSKNYPAYAGLFFYGDKESEYILSQENSNNIDTDFGTLTTYDMADDIKLYQGYSSEDYCYKNSLGKTPNKMIKQFLISAEIDPNILKGYEQDLSLEDVYKNNLADYTNDPSVIFAITQYLAKEHLEQLGYDGVEWQHEDDLTPNQYQIWNLKKLKRLNDAIKEDLEMSNEYDSEGNQLTKAQAEFFKDSKVRDNKGRLLVCYHGTKTDFDVFDNDKSMRGMVEGGLYFTTDKQIGLSYGRDGKVLSTYLDITGYLDLTNHSKEYIQDIKEVIPQEQIELGKQYELDESMYDFYLINLANLVYKTWGWYKNACEVIYGWGFDGVKQDTETYVAFKSNQIKSITNKNPTNSDNINERMKVDKMKLSQTQDRRRKLTDEQKEQIKDLYKTGEYSLNQLAQEYGVSKKLILLIVNPESKAKNDARIKAHWQDYYDREEHNKAIKNLRDYKKDLLAKGELKETLLYHRSPNRFDELSASRVGSNQGRARTIQGYWFFDFDDKSKTHGEHLYQANVDTSNFYRTNSKKKLLNKDNIKAFLKKYIPHMLDEKGNIDYYQTGYIEEKLSSQNGIESLLSYASRESGESVTNIIKDLGYSGIIYDDHEYVVFDKSDIKDFKRLK